MMDFPKQHQEERKPSNGYHAFLAMLRVIEELQPAVERIYKGRGHVSLIAHNKGSKNSRYKMDPAMKQRFGIRSTVERVKSHLKDWLFPSKLMVRGYKKVALSFNAMAEKLEKLLKNEKELLDLTSHELRTPLVMIKLALEIRDKKRFQELIRLNY